MAAGRGPSQPCASSLARQLARSLLMVAMDRLPGSENIFWNRNGVRLRSQFSTSPPTRLRACQRRWRASALLPCCAGEGRSCGPLNPEGPGQFQACLTEPVGSREPGRHTLYAP